MILGMNPGGTPRRVCDRTEAAAVRLRDLLAAGKLEDSLRRWVPAFRDRVCTFHDLRFESHPWKGPVAIEGSLRLDWISAAGRPRAQGEWRAFRMTPGEVVPVRGPGCVRRGGLFSGYDADHDLDLRVSPDDPDLPELERLLAGGSFVSLGPLHRVQLLGHRFGRRASLRAETLGGRTVVLKLFTKKRAERHARTLEAVADPRAARTPNVLAVGRDLRTLALEFLPGRVLFDHWNDVEPPELESVGEALRRLSEVAPWPSGIWTAVDELSTIRRFTDRLAHFDSSLANEIRTRSAQVPWKLRGAAPVRVHRDLHDRQIVLSERTPAVLDWDLAAAGPPEIDAANFVAHLQLRVLQKRLPAERLMSLRDAFLRGYLAGRSQPEVLAAWEQLSLLRLAAVYGLRPGQSGVARDLLRAGCAVEVAR